MNVLVLMAGRGSRLGVSVPRQLRKVGGRTVAEVAVRSLGLDARRDARFLFAVAAEHCERFGLDHLLRSLVPDCRVRQLPWPQRGPAYTAYQCRDEIETKEPLLICHGDQLLDWDPGAFLRAAEDAEVTILHHERRSAGVFHWCRGADFCRAYAGIAAPAPRLDDVVDVVQDAGYVVRTVNARAVRSYDDYTALDVPPRAV